ncbi:DUF998 domain-containing protein [Hyphococcus sp.]|uniref:DUF998 domain-containing protein n=1 Tax=Hyphococcus sp. TaxID=2038636 RepID=UPI003D11444D
MHIAASVLLILCGVLLPSALGILWAEYDPASSYLSELGASGAPHAAIMNYGGFLPVGILWALAATMLYARSPKNGLLLAGAFLLLGNSVSYLGASIFHCDAGCPMEGSGSQAMHNLLGVIGYLATPPALACIGLASLSHNKLLASLSFLTAAACLIGFVTMASPEAAHIRGLAQRSVDFTQFFWMFAAALLIKQKSG